MKKNKKKVLKIVIPAALAVVVLGTVVVKNISKAGEAMAQAMEVDTITAEMGDVTETVETSGIVVSGQQKTFFSPVNAMVETADFQVGDMVKAGDRLVTFNLKDLEQQNQKAELTVKANALGYQDTINKSADAAQKQADAKIQAVSLQQQVDAKKQEVENLTAAITGEGQIQAAAMQQESDSIIKQIEELQTQQGEANKLLEESKKTYEKAQAAQQTAQVNFDAATATAGTNPAGVTTASEALKKANKELSNAKSNYEALQIQADNLNSQIAGCQASLTAAGTNEGGAAELQQKLTMAQTELAELQGKLETQKAMGEGESAALTKEAKAQMQTTNNLAELEQKSVAELIEEGKKGISAEFTGIISDNQVVEGAAAAQGMQLFTLQSIDNVDVNITLSKNVYEKVKEGQKATITFAGQTYKGTVTRISRIATSAAGGSNTAVSTSITATVHIDKPDNNIFLGVEAKVSIHAAEAKNVVILPTEAVNIGKEGAFCWVSEDGVLTKRSIETGVASDDTIEITKGLKEGEKVITDPGSHEEGDSVIIANEQKNDEKENAVAE